jgi:hypothetical protein
MKSRQTVGHAAVNSEENTQDHFPESAHDRLEMGGSNDDG